MAKKLTYEYVKEYIESFSGYKLLSKEYINNKTKIKYMCPEDHKFEMKYGHFKMGQRCPICNNEKKKLTYKYVKEYIESFGYKLLSKEYINNSTKMKLQCPEGHIYYVIYNSFKQGNRCPECFGIKKFTYEQVKEYIEDFGYKLISTEHINTHTKMEFICPEGHKFEMTYGNFQQGQRCPICSIKIVANKKRFTYEQVKEYIENFGYKLLSKEYINAHTKMKLQCPEGHKFLMQYNNFQQGQRCPECSNKISKDEKEMCEYVKSLTNELILENDRTQIINPLTRYNLELDIYVPSLNKAIEFNGDYWHCNPEKYDKDYFNDRIQMYAYQIWERDKEKVKQCKEKDIDLMIIWENDWKNSKEQCKNNIKQFLKN